MFFKCQADKTKEELEYSRMLNECYDIFSYYIPLDLPKYIHSIDLVPISSPPNKPLYYRVSKAQKDNIMRQVKELVDKGMV